MSYSQVIVQSSCFSLPLPGWFLVSFRGWATVSMLCWNRKAKTLLLKERGIAALELSWRASPVDKDERTEHLEQCHPSLRRLLALAGWLCCLSCYVPRTALWEAALKESTCPKNILCSAEPWERRGVFVPFLQAWSHCCQFCFALDDACTEIDKYWILLMVEERAENSPPGACEQRVCRGEGCACGVSHVPIDLARERWQLGSQTWQVGRESLQPGMHHGGMLILLFHRGKGKLLHWVLRWLTDFMHVDGLSVLSAFNGEVNKPTRFFFFWVVLEGSFFSLVSLFCGFLLRNNTYSHQLDQMSVNPHLCCSSWRSD